MGHYLPRYRRKLFSVFEGCCFFFALQTLCKGDDHCHGFVVFSMCSLLLGLQRRVQGLWHCFVASLVILPLLMQVSSHLSRAFSSLVPCGFRTVFPQSLPCALKSPQKMVFPGSVSSISSTLSLRLYCYRRIRLRCFLLAGL